MVFEGTYLQSRRFCRKHKIKVHTRENVKGGWRLCITVPKDVELRDGRTLKEGIRVLRINPQPKPVEATDGPA